MTLTEAKRIAERAIEEARDLNIRICVAVSDAGGRLVVLNRMDGAVWASVHSSQGKALTSAGFNISSRRIGAGHARLFWAAGRCS
jgi:glc operon protein GlcG